jgi:type I restriction enzyme, S subunit
MKYKKYPSYKDSGVEWLGEIPSAWTNNKIKFLGYTYGGLSGKSGKDFGEQENIISKRFIPFTNIANNTFIKDDNLGYVVINKGEEQNKVKKDDLFFLMSSESYEDLGKSSLLELNLEDTYLNSFCKGFRITNKSINPRFLNYLLSADVYRKLLYTQGNGFTRINLRLEKLNDLEFYVPSKQEQQQIAKFLDNVTQKMDTLIQKQENLIKLLKEKRQAVISHAVTQGLNPDVKFKDSGVEWLGDVPEHWGVGLLSTLFDNNKDKNKGMKNNNLLSLSYGKIVNKDIDTAFGLLPESFESYQIVKPGYIILRLTDLQNDKKSLRTGLVTEKGIITSAYVGLKKKSKSIGNEKFIHYYLHTFDIYKGFYGMGSGVRQSLNFDELKKLRFLVPPINEQDEIVNFIDDKTTKIDTLIKKATKSIKLLKEKRTALISAAVTGKIDVRELV